LHFAANNGAGPMGRYQIGLTRLTWYGHDWPIHIYWSRKKGTIRCTCGLLLLAPKWFE